MKKLIAPFMLGLSLLTVYAQERGMRVSSPGSERRVALVIGNGAYADGQTPGETFFPDGT